MLSDILRTLSVLPLFSLPYIALPCPSFSPLSALPFSKYTCACQILPCVHFMFHADAFFCRFWFHVFVHVIMWGLIGDCPPF